MGFIDGSKPCPPETILADKDLVPNPAHLTWITQDQYIASWLMATLSESILSQVVSPAYQSALSIWSKVEQICVSSSKLHALQLRGQLQNLKKLSTPMDDYIQSIKKISNTLTAMGSPLSDSDLFFYTLGGLGSDYETFITTVSLQQDTIPFDNLCTLLCHQELHLASIHTTTSSTALSHHLLLLYPRSATSKESFFPSSLSSPRSWPRSWLLLTPSQHFHLLQYHPPCLSSLQEGWP